jgi:hypothetical protein
MLAEMPPPTHYRHKHNASSPTRTRTRTQYTHTHARAHRRTHHAHYIARRHTRQVAYRPLPLASVHRLLLQHPTTHSHPEAPLNRHTLVLGRSCCPLAATHIHEGASAPLTC